MPAFVRHLTDEQELELIELYRNPRQSIAELKDTYRITDSVLYAILKRHNEPTRTGRQTRPHASNGTHTVDTQSMVVTVDATDTVQRVDRIPPDPQTGPHWEVRFTGVIQVRGHSIDQALAEARKLQTVRSIIYVARIGGES